MSTGVAGRTSPPVSASFLVSRVKMGDKEAWDALVERYASLIWFTCRRYRLNGADAEDVGQCVWLQLVEHGGVECVDRLARERPLLDRRIDLGRAEARREHVTGDPR